MEINRGRLEEIATMALHRLLEIDPDSAQRFMIEEIEMNKEEVDSFGAARLRTATEIEWDDYDDSLPSEVDIPWDVFDDDIENYLAERFDTTVIDYEIEEDD